MKEKFAECFGGVLKEEHLWCRSEIGMSNTCILESLVPYPGYYGPCPHETKPNFVYLITKTKYPLEDILRASKQNKAKFPEIDIAISDITIFDETLSSVRIGKLEDYSLVMQIQSNLSKKGIQFYKKTRDIKNVPAIIKTHKFFRLHEYCDTGVFMDMVNTNNGYFVIPDPISWDDFKTNLRHIRNNHPDYHFDAATGFFFYSSDILDFVRIYTKNNSFGFMNHLSKIYNQI